MGFIRSFAQKIGLDKSIAYSSGARIVQGVAGVGSIFFISTFLTGVEQGFYYTFASILALQVFFELGLTGIITQYVAHEASHLELDADKQYVGEEKYKSRLGSLVHFCVKWYTVISALVFVCLQVAGYVYFSKFGDTQAADVVWRLPWILICVGTSLQLFISPLSAILSGLGFVKDVAKISFWQQIFIPLSIWVGLACGFKLYVTGIGYILSTLVWVEFVYRHDLITILKNLWLQKVTERISYMREIFPFQWRIALSWVSGYFIFQLFNPVLFATEGAIIAGQMGMTLQALNAIQAFSMSWLNTKVPLYSILIAHGDYVQLDIIFNRTLKQMVSICATLLFVFFCLVALLRITHVNLNGNVFADRFLSYVPMLLMIVPVVLQQYNNSWATYLRCHKKEPFLLNSVVCGILCLTSTVVLGNLYGLYGVTVGYFCIQLALFPWGYKIFKNYKIKWHGE